MCNVRAIIPESVRAIIPEGSRKRSTKGLVDHTFGPTLFVFLLSPLLFFVGLGA
jgi:hypothetical protein